MKRASTTKRVLPIAAIALMSLALFASTATAHFQSIIPNRVIVDHRSERDLHISLDFFHPFDQTYMNMAKPDAFGLLLAGKNTDLLSSLKEVKRGEVNSWEADYTLKRPGDHVFYLQPSPYFEPAEDRFIVHYTKVIVHGFGLEDGWDTKIGMKAEIIPMVRPYGLWTGNLFQGRVLFEDKPVPFAEVEVEYYNEGGKVKLPAAPFATQVIKADGDGVFSYAIPREGWWGFAALMDDPKPLKHKGENKKVEAGAVIWIHTQDMK